MTARVRKESVGAGYARQRWHRGQVVRYFLQARLIEGPLRAPTRNESRLDESGDLAEVEQLAKKWVARFHRVDLRPRPHRRGLGR